MSAAPVEAYPLQWPFGWKRTDKWQRTDGRYRVDYAKAISDLQNELRRMGGSSLVISSNVPVRRDGLPYADATRKRVEDPGVAAYFVRKAKQHALACDRFTWPKDNLRAIGRAVAAMREIERTGTSELLDRTFQGFRALPPGRGNNADNADEPWWETLGVNPEAPPAEVEMAYKRAAQKAHPDHGGSLESMAKLNRARDDWRSQMGGELP